MRYLDTLDTFARLMAVKNNAVVRILPGTPLFVYLETHCLGNKLYQCCGENCPVCVRLLEILSNADNKDADKLDAYRRVLGKQGKYYYRVMIREKDEHEPVIMPFVEVIHNIIQEGVQKPPIKFDELSRWDFRGQFKRWWTGWVPPMVLDLEHGLDFQIVKNVGQPGDLQYSDSHFTLTPCPAGPPEIIAELKRRPIDLKQYTYIDSSDLLRGKLLGPRDTLIIGPKTEKK